MSANLVLLLGAGFSRNWGGWLASEVFEYLLGSEEVDAALREVLLQNRNKGFESALDFLQAAQLNNGGAPDLRLTNLKAALGGMFSVMNQGLNGAGINGRIPSRYWTERLLVRFDAIFTLNQDTLLEAHYLNESISRLPRSRWKGWAIPGMRPIDAPKRSDRPALVSWEPEVGVLSIDPTLQPYIKLHGSSNWRGRDDGELLIVGGNKDVAIKRSRLLAWYFATFEEYVSRPGTRLMVIGYSFRDDHINRLIEAAAARADFRIFIVDPRGLDVLAPPMSDVLISKVRGCSRRSLLESLGGDFVEHANLERFLNQV